MLYVTAIAQNFGTTTGLTTNAQQTSTTGNNQWTSTVNTVTNSQTTG